LRLQKKSISRESGELEEKATSPGCFVCDDPILGRGQETPENHPLIVFKGVFYRLVVLFAWSKVTTFCILAKAAQSTIKEFLRDKIFLAD
jgi:hypothetical protein